MKPGKTYFGLILLVTAFITSCGLNDPGAMLPNFQRGNSQEPIEQIFELDVMKGTSSADWVYVEAKEFNINNYNNIDSIVFATLLRSQKSTEKAIAELYDFTNQRSVLNSTVEANVRYVLNYVESANILPTIAKDLIIIGIRLKSSAEGHFVEVSGGNSLIIYTH